MNEQKHPNRVTCPRCGQPGTKQSSTNMCNKTKCTKCPHGPYWYVAHRVGSRVLKCYIGKNQPDWMEAKIIAN